MPNSSGDKDKTIFIDSKDLESITGDDIIDIVNTINEEYDKIPVDTFDLENLITDASEALSDTSKTYTEESRNALSAVIDTATELIDDPDVTQEQIDAKLQELQNALDGLTEVVQVDTSSLEEIIERATTVLNDSTKNYTEETKGVLSTAVEAAQNALTSEDITQEEVDEHVQAIEDAIDGLIEDTSTEPSTDPENPDQEGE